MACLSSGDPQNGRRLSYMRNLWLYFLSGFLSLALLALVGVQILFNWKVDPLIEKSQSIQRQHLNLYLGDLAFLAQDGLPSLTRSEAHSDAGATLNQRLYWTPPHHPLAAGIGREHPIVPVSVRENLLRLGSDWIRRHKKLAKTQVDFSLFDDLSSFDHWNIENQSPIAKIKEHDVFVPPNLLPTPETSDLTALAQLRLMRGAADNDALRALKDVRRLAELMLTTENLELTLAGVSILDDERKAYRYFVDTKGLPASAWTPIDPSTTRRANRAIRATRGYLRLWTPTDLSTRIFLGDFAPVGLCAAANEALPQEFTLRPLLEPKWPFERDYRDDYKHLDQIWARIQSHCRVQYLRHLVEIGNFKAPLPGPFLFNRLPYSRKVFGMRFDVANFTGFDAYNKLPSSASNQ